MWDKILLQNTKNRFESSSWFLPKKKKKSVEISDESGFSKIFERMAQAARDCKISNPSAIKYALDNGKPSIKRRSDKKYFLFEK